MPLSNGRDLTGWTPRSAQHAGCWRVQGAVLAATPPCVDLVSDATFRDFRLHAELRFPPGSNSGIYLRGRYEVQIQDDAGKALDPLRMGGVYGFIAPSVDAARAAGEWQTLDVELVGRRVTVVLNGTTIVDDAGDSRHHGRRARQRRGRAGADHAAGRSRRRSSFAT